MKGEALGLVPKELAEADAASLRPLAEKPIPYKGYYFLALTHDEAMGHEVLMQETDGKSGKVHHPSMFSFCAYPAEHGVTGRMTYYLTSYRNFFGLDLEGKLPCGVCPSPRTKEYRESRSRVIID